MLLGVWELSSSHPLFPRCGACTANAKDWDALKESPTLRESGYRFHEVNVDANRALTEAFGINRIPSFFIIRNGRVAKINVANGFRVDDLVKLHKQAELGPDLVFGAMDGIFKNPIGPLYILLVGIGYVIEGYYELLKGHGLDGTWASVAIVASVSLVLAAWGISLWCMLTCCCPTGEDVDVRSSKKAGKKTKKD